MNALAALGRWLDDTVLEVGREFRWSYLPPLMVYAAAGVSGLTQVVATFFIKDYLGLSAAFLAGLSFWAGIPWALKMPLGHLVDLIWRWKAVLVYFGALLITASVLIMFALIAHTDAMAEILPVATWFIIGAILAPVGYVVQDVVADAMTVEAVPVVDPDGKPFDEEKIKLMHTTMQTLGRIAIIGGTILVALLNVTMFAGVQRLSEAQTADVYANIYLMALGIPLLSISGVILGGIFLRRRARRLREEGLSDAHVRKLLFEPEEATEPNWWILIGSLIFVVFTVGMGAGDAPYSQEIVFVGSMAIVSFLIHRLVRELPDEDRRQLIGTAIIIFVFRAVPLPGPGYNWFAIDVLGFDQQFFAILQLIVGVLTMAGMFIFRHFMATHSIAAVVAILTVAQGILELPNIGLYYGIHEWTAPLTGGVVDARFIAIIDTALESPLGQVAMIPMLAWIAKNAPSHLKATFFAVMASFTNLALSASSLGTKYINEIYSVTREVRDRETGEVTVPADYSELGWLLITVAIITVAAPLLTILFVQMSRLRTQE